MLQTQDVFERLKSLLIELLKVNQEKSIKVSPEITMETDLFDDLGMDSVEALDLMSAIEREFGVSIKLEEAIAKKKIREFVSYVISLHKKES